MDFHHPYSRGLPRSEEPALFIRPPPRATPHPPHLPYSLHPSSTPYASMAYGPAAYSHHQAHSQSQPQQQGQQQQQQQPHYQPPTAASFSPTSTAPLSVPPSISQPSAPLESSSYRFPPVNHGPGMNQNQNQHQNRDRGRSYSGSHSHSRSNSYSYSQNHSPRVAAGVNKTNAIFGEGRGISIFFFLFCFVLFYCKLLFVLCLPRATPYWSPTVELDTRHATSQSPALSCLSAIQSAVRHPASCLSALAARPAMSAPFAGCCRHASRSPAERQLGSARPKAD